MPPEWDEKVSFLATGRHSHILIFIFVCCLLITTTTTYSSTYATVSTQQLALAHTFLAGAATIITQLQPWHRPTTGCTRLATENK